MAKAVKTSRTRTPLTPEARENLMISLAMDLAESIKSADRQEELMVEAMKAMRRYQGTDDEEEEEIFDEY